jgi:hypothetical protein
MGGLTSILVWARWRALERVDSVDLFPDGAKKKGHRLAPLLNRETLS